MYKYILTKYTRVLSKLHHTILFLRIAYDFSVVVCKKRSSHLKYQVVPCRRQGDHSEKEIVKSSNVCLTLIGAVVMDHRYTLSRKIEKVQIYTRTNGDDPVLRPCFAAWVAGWPQRVGSFAY